MCGKFMLWLWWVFCFSLSFSLSPLLLLLTENEIGETPLNSLLSLFLFLFVVLWECVRWTKKGVIMCVRSSVDKKFFSIHKLSAHPKPPPTTPTITTRTGYLHRIYTDKKRCYSTKQHHIESETQVKLEYSRTHALTNVLQTSLDTNIDPVQSKAITIENDIVKW